MTAIAARARGLTTTVIAGEVLAAIDAAGDGPALARAIARAGLPLPAGTTDPDAIDRIARDRVASDLAILSRRGDALSVVALDEDRRSLRAIVRGIAAGASAERRLAGAVPTARLPAAVLAALAAATSLGDAAALLQRRHHPLADSLVAPRTPIDTLAIELALARRFAEHAEHARARDPALRAYLAQLIDAENAGAALLYASRGGDLSPAGDPDQAADLAGARSRRRRRAVSGELRRAATNRSRPLPRGAGPRRRAPESPAAPGFLDGGRLIDRSVFTAAAAGPLDAACARLAAALARTPLAAAVFAPGPAALEDATLDWQLATQARLRRTEPLGLAPALYVVLRRRDEARHLRRAAWRVALGGAA